MAGHVSVLDLEREAHEGRGIGRSRTPNADSIGERQPASPRAAIAVSMALSWVSRVSSSATSASSCFTKPANACRGGADIITAMS